MVGCGARTRDRQSSAFGRQASERSIQKRTDDGGGGEGRRQNIVVTLPDAAARERRGERVDYLEYDRHSLCLVGKEGGRDKLAEVGMRGQLVEAQGWFDSSSQTASRV